MRFLPFLPGEEETPESIAVTSELNASLGQLLRADAKTFWDTVQADKSLHICLDSYLRHRRCVPLRRTRTHSMHHPFTTCDCFGAGELMTSSIQRRHTAGYQHQMLTHCWRAGCS